MTDTTWTWMMYLATHNNVAAAGVHSLGLVESGIAREQPGGSVRVLVQQATPTECVRRIVGATPEVVANLGQVDSGDPATLLDFIRWAVTTAPAQRYVLVIWSHGSGWEPSEIARVVQPAQPTPVPVTLDELNDRSADDGNQVFFSTTMRTLLAQPTPPTRAIAFDDGSGHSIDTVELGQVMAQATQILGQPIDLLGMNACLMSAAEVAYQLRNSVQVYVASEALMPAQSLPYDDILARLTAQPDIDVAALGKLIVDRYCAFFSTPSEGAPQGVTLAALRLAGIDRLATAVQAFASTLQADMNSELRAIWDAHRAAHPFQFRLYDLASFCQSFITQPTATPGSITAAQDVLTALTNPAFLLSAQHTSPDYDNTGGVSTYLMPPAQGRTISPYYAETDYAQATGWGKFLAAYQAAVQ